MANESKYAFLMIRFNTPDIIKEIQEKLSDDDLYYGDDSRSGLGIETDTHVTLVPCLDNNVDLDDIKDMLEPLDKYQTFLTNISMFDNPDFEVLKCDASSIPLFNTNKLITDKYPTHSDYKEYHPHATIAYVKHGVAEKYTKDVLDKLIVLEPKEFWFSYYDENGNEKEVTWK